MHLHCVLHCNWVFRWTSVLWFPSVKSVYGHPNVLSFESWKLNVNTLSNGERFFFFSIVEVCKESVFPNLSFCLEKKGFAWTIVSIWRDLTEIWVFIPNAHSLVRLLRWFQVLHMSSILVNWYCKLRNFRIKSRFFCICIFQL